MKQYICLLSILFTVSVAFSQKSPPDFGKIDMADMLLKSCDFEPDAAAMRLFDVQEIEIEIFPYNTRLVTERRVRLKIFNEKGYKNASIRIPYFSKKRSTKIKDLEGIVYNLGADGKIVVQKLEKKDFFKEKEQDNVSVINFTFPNLKPGSVVEFRYKKVEKDILQIDPWVPQDEIPTAYASTVLITPEFSRVKEKVLGADTIEQKKERLEKGNRDKRTYYREKIPSFRPEPFMSSYKDNQLKVIFLLIPYSNFFIDVMTRPEAMWRFVGSTLLESEHFGKQVKKTIPGTETIIDSAKKITSIADRIAFIYDTVKKRAPEKAEQTFYAGDLTEAWNDKTGNTAELNLILLNLLQKSGVLAYPILISTRENGKVDMQFPSMGQLNGVDVLAADSNKVYIMDASLKYQSSLDPPFNILNRNAFLLEENNMRWIAVTDDRPLLKQTMLIQSAIKEDGSIEGAAYNWYYGYAKSFVLDSTSDDDKEDKFFDKKPQGLTIVSLKQENENIDSMPLLHTVNFKYEPQHTNDFYFINPQLLSATKENPFTKDIRNTDIDFGCNQELNLRLHIEIPETFQIDHLPQNILVRAPDSSFLFTRRIVVDSTRLFLSQTFEIKQSVFYRDQYPGIQEFFKRVFALMAEEIILKKRK